MSGNTHERQPQTFEDVRLDGAHKDPPAALRETRDSGARARPGVERSRTAPLWWAWACLVMLLAGASYYGYSTLQKANLSLSQIPDVLRSMNALQSRLGDAEAEIRNWAQNSGQLAARLNQLDHSMRADYRLARRHAETLTAQFHSQVQEELAQRSAVVDSRLNRLEGDQQAARERLEQLHQEIASAREEVATLRSETHGNLAALDQQVAGNGQRVDELTRRVEPRQVNFEAAKNRAQQVTEEISLKITGTDVGHQRYSGWIYFLPDRRTLWLRGQGVQRPVIFYSRGNPERYEVVVTSVNADSAVGFLLLPPGSGAAFQAETEGRTDAGGQ